MRLRRTLLALSTIPLAAGTLAFGNPDGGDFLFAQCDQAVGLLATTATLTADEPGSFEAGNGCGAVALPGAENGGFWAATWNATYEGEITSLELRTHSLLGSAAYSQLGGQDVTNTIPVLVVIDGETVFEGEVTDLGRVQELYVSHEHDWFIDLSDAGIGDGTHEVSISFGHPAAQESPFGASPLYAWGNNDGTPGGVTFNAPAPADLAGTP